MRCAYIGASHRPGDCVQKVATSTRKIIARLLKEGWKNIGGSKHDRFAHPNHPGVRVVVPRHRDQYPGTAYSIAKSAGWI
jgi:predicted RNA binding protein YcfA (HicA-like mRNA interferase family)